MNPQKLDLSPLSGSTMRALWIYVHLGLQALPLLDSGLVDEAVGILERRKFVLHNFRVQDHRLRVSGVLTTKDELEIARLGRQAIDVDRDIELAISRVQSNLLESLTDLSNRKKIGRYRSGHTDRPVVEREV
jgi:hypothetical protein